METGVFSFTKVANVYFPWFARLFGFVDLNIVLNRIFAVYK